jgi:hypothetical protein
LGKIHKNEQNIVIAHRGDVVDVVIRSESNFVIALVMLLQLFLPGLVFADPPCMEKRIIGQECWVHIEELNLEYLARVDTGATTTSIHATDFIITDGTDNPQENIGKIINFLTLSTGGEYKSLEAEIAKVQTVFTARGSEKRYMVWLTVTANGISKKILVNLRDRSRMKYKLLMGRDWLAQDFLVDVDMPVEGMLAEEGEEE